MRATLFLLILIGSTRLNAQSCTNTEELLRPTIRSLKPSLCRGTADFK